MTALGTTVRFGISSHRTIGQPDASAQLIKEKFQPLQSKPGENVLVESENVNVSSDDVSI